jgi:hypothetical protein
LFCSRMVTVSVMVLLLGFKQCVGPGEVPDPCSLVAYASVITSPQPGHIGGP